jgi:hypothetical protein
MTVNVYASTDSGAPALTGEAGKLIALLDAILVNGYGAKSGAGWTKAYSDTNKAAYRTGGGNQMYLRMVDDGTGAATYARAAGYESMSDIDTGTGDFPTNAQVSGGLYWYKSSAASSAERAWFAVATDSFLLLYVDVASSGTGASAAAFAFGDISSYNASDAYHTIHIGATVSSPTSGGNLHLLGIISTTEAGHYMARSYTQLGASLLVGKHSDGRKGTQDFMGNGSLPYPHPVDGGLYLAPVWVHEISGPVVRGIIPGLWNPLHNQPLAHGDTFDGVGSLAGKSFKALSIGSSQIVVETSNTW